MLFLPPDILDLINGHLAVRHVKNLALAHRALYPPARYRILRDITLNLKAADLEPTYRWLRTLELEGLLSAVRMMTVLDDEDDYLRQVRRDCNRKDINAFHSAQSLRDSEICRALRAMSGLLQLDWRGGYLSPAVLEFLKQTPQVKLSAQIRICRQRTIRAINESTDSFIHRLRHNSNLHALDVEVEYHRANECGAYMRLLKTVLLTCPNLRKLRLDIHFPPSGCTVYSARDEYHGLGFVGTERPPALEELDLVAYPFGAPASGSRTESTIGYRAALEEQAFWAQHFDWSQLRCLKLPQGRFIKLLTPRLSASLRHIAFHGQRQDVQPFFENVETSLQSITLDLRSSIGVVSLFRHRNTLTKLVMHGEESYCHDWAERCHELQALRRLGSCFHSLQDLEIDVCRKEGDWPWEVLGVLASSYPQLQKLALWFPLPISVVSYRSVDKPEEPYVTFSTVTMLCSYLRDHGSKMTELVVHSGAPPATPMGDVGEETEYPQDMSMTFRCSLAERDLDAAHGHFITTCLDVDERANEWMRAQMSRPLSGHSGGRMNFAAFYEEAGPFASKAARRALQVAWFGPMTLEEWMEDTGGLM